MCWTWPVGMSLSAVPMDWRLYSAHLPRMLSLFLLRTWRSWARFWSWGLQAAPGRHCIPVRVTCAQCVCSTCPSSAWPCCTGTPTTRPQSSTPPWATPTCSWHRCSTLLSTVSNPSRSRLRCASDLGCNVSLLENEIFSVSRTDNRLKNAVQDRLCAKKCVRPCELQYKKYSGLPPKKFLIWRQREREAADKHVIVAATMIIVQRWLRRHGRRNTRSVFSCVNWMKSPRPAAGLSLVCAVKDPCGADGVGTTGCHLILNCLRCFS